MTQRNETRQLLEAMEAELQNELARWLIAVRDDMDVQSPADDEDNDESEDNWVDVRIQVYENGAYAFHSGDSSFDQDHRGHWGCGCLSAASEDVALVDTARDMVEQVLDSVAQSE